MYVKIQNPSELLELRDEYDELTIEFLQPLKRAKILNIKANKLLIKGRCEKLKIHFTTAVEINTESSILDVDISNNFLLKYLNNAEVEQPPNISIIHDLVFDESNADSIRKLITNQIVAIVRCKFNTKVDLSGCKIKTIYVDDSVVQSLSLDFNFGLRIINFYGRERHYSFFGCGSEIEQIKEDQMDNSMSTLSISSVILRKHGILMDGFFDKSQLLDQSNIILYIINFVGDVDLHNVDISELYIYDSNIGKLDIRGCKIYVFYSDNTIESLVDGIVDISEFNILEINRFNFNEFYEQTLLIPPTTDTFIFRDISIGGDTLKNKLNSYTNINTIIFKGSINLGSSDLSNLEKKVIIFDNCFNNPNAVLNISNNQLIFDSSSFVQLKALIISNCNIDNVDIDYGNHIKQLVADHNNLTNFDGSRFDELESLDISYNKLKSIYLPFKLEFLNCSHNDIKILTCNTNGVNASFNVDLNSFNGCRDLKRIISKGYRTSDFYMTKLYSSLYRGCVDITSDNEILVPSQSYSVDINTDKKIIKFIPESFDSSLSFVAINSDTVEEIYMPDLGVEKVFLKTPNLKRFDAENGNLTNIEINENIEILNLSGNSQPITINEQGSYSTTFFIYDNSPDLPKLLKYKPSFNADMFKNIAPDYGLEDIDDIELFSDEKIELPHYSIMQPTVEMQPTAAFRVTDKSQDIDELQSFNIQYVETMKKIEDLSNNFADMIVTKIANPNQYNVADINIGNNEIDNEDINLVDDKVNDGVDNVIDNEVDNVDNNEDVDFVDDKVDENNVVDEKVNVVNNEINDNGSDKVNNFVNDEIDNEIDNKGDNEIIGFVDNECVNFVDDDANVGKSSIIDTCVFQINFVM